MSSTVAKRSAGACPDCHALSGVHVKGCPSGRVKGHGVGLRRQRSLTDVELWERTKLAVFDRDRRRCQVCGTANAVHAHHLETVQKVLARGGTYADADTLENCVAVCAGCHERIHSAAGRDWAVQEGWLL